MYLGSILASYLLFDQVWIVLFNSVGPFHDPNKTHNIYIYYIIYIRWFQTHKTIIFLFSMHKFYIGYKV